MKTVNSPLISVIIPVFNGSKFISEAIDSVFAQSYSNFELIVVDDGSTDDSFTKISQFKRVQYIKQTNSGPAVARNLGSRISKGAYIAFLDQDDVWITQKLEKQVSYLVNSPELSFVLCNHEAIFEKNEKRVPSIVRKGIDSRKSTSMESFSPSAILMRKDIFKSFGGFNERYPFYSEAELLLRLRQSKAQFFVVPEILMKKRYHEANLCYRKKITYAELLKIARSSVIRSRAQYQSSRLGQL